MILYASQRGRSAELAAHLLNGDQNDHVTVHEIRGFVAQDLPGALREAYAISRGTRCKQFLFSVSLNPPEYADVPIEAFEVAIEQIELKMGLVDQPRIIVFHEKNGRRHCHAVWSRIDADKLVAVNMAHFKRKLMEISRLLFMKHGWKLPKGMIRAKDKNPFSLTRQEYRQAVRLSEDPKALKAMFKSAWEQSDSKAGFIRALEEHGFLLAKGDRRGYVTIDIKGGIWQRVTGEFDKIRQLNEAETKASLARDRQELHQMIRAQLLERQDLQKSILFYRDEQKQDMLRLRQEVAHYISTATEPFIPKQETTEHKEPPLAAQLEQLETKIALLSGDVHQLQTSLESNLLSEEMRARIRRMIERTLETLHIKAIEEKQQLTRTEERQNEVERKQVELNQYIRHYAELQHKQEELHKQQDANRQFYAVVTHMSYSLNGLPQWDIRIQSPPPEKRLDETAYVANIRQLKNRELLHTITTTERPNPVIAPETAAPNLRQSVLEAKEILRRAGLQPGGDDSPTAAPVRIRMTDAPALSTRFTQRRQ